MTRRTSRRLRQNAATVLITGNTFPVKEQLKDLGGRWDPVAKGWRVPEKNAARAQALVSGPTRYADPAPRKEAPRPAPRPRAPAYRGPAPGEISIERRARGGRAERYSVGDVVYMPKETAGGGPKGHYWTVTHQGFSRADEDMGDYDDKAWAYVRPATDAEASGPATRRENTEAKEAGTKKGVAFAEADEAATVAHLISAYKLVRTELPVPETDRKGAVWTLIGKRGDTSTWQISLPDGRQAINQTSVGYDDHRSLFSVPRDIAERAVLGWLAKQAAAGQEVTTEAARDWLSKYDGASGSEVYRLVLGLDPWTKAGKLQANRRTSRRRTSRRRP